MHKGLISWDLGWRSGGRGWQGREEVGGGRLGKRLGWEWGIGGEWLGLGWFGMMTADRAAWGFGRRRIGSLIILGLMILAVRKGT